jgi:uncharacterized RDD family membrane protein YckC
MEQNDDFEMKPLTPGLGFHKRQIQLKEELAKTGVVQQNLRRSIPDAPHSDMLGDPNVRSSKQIIAELHDALKPLPVKKESIADRVAARLAGQLTNQSNVQFSEVLPREIGDISPNHPSYIPNRKNPSTPEISPFDKINFQIPDKSLSENLGARRGGHDNLVSPLSPIAVSFTAGILDAALVLAMSLIFLVSLIMVTGVDLLSVLQSSQNEFATQVSMAILYIAVLEMYVVVARSFFGMTVGEWTFDLQMGQNDQIAQASYPAKVLFRSMLVLITGVFVLPVLSLIFSKDLAGSLVGIKLYKRNI